MHNSFMRNLSRCLHQNLFNDALYKVLGSQFFFFFFFSFFFFRFIFLLQTNQSKDVGVKWVQRDGQPPFSDGGRSGWVLNGILIVFRGDLSKEGSNFFQRGGLTMETTVHLCLWQQIEVFLKAFILSNNCSRICEYVRGSFLIKLVTYIPSKLIEQIYFTEYFFRKIEAHRSNALVLIYEKYTRK